MSGGEFPSKENQFKPGKSGNPGGRPKGTSITARILQMLADVEKGDDKRTGAEIIADTMIARAKAGDHKFVSIILDRSDGPVEQKISTTHDFFKTIDKDAAKDV